MCLTKKYIFNSYTSIEDILNEIYNDISPEKVKLVELNEDVLNYIKDLELEDYYSDKIIVIEIKNIDDVNELEYVLNDMLHKIYSQCELQKSIHNNKKIKKLLQELEYNENKCENIKCEILRRTYNKL